MGIFFGKIFRAILAALDDAVYKFVELLYGLFFDISQTGIFKTQTIQSFASRIYFFLGLIMVFKVSISIINYIMNPDSLKDSKIGASKLVKNIIIILIGIVLVPYIFEAAYSLQRIVLRDNVIGNLILGQQYNKSTDSEKLTKEAGRRMAFTTYTAFFHLSDDFFTEECYTNPFQTDDKGNVTNELNPACIDSGEGNNLEDNKAAITPIQDDYFEAYSTQNVRDLTKFKLINATVDTEDDEEEFLFSYMYLIATLGGAFLAYVLLVFCFDIAVRSVKLGFLQLIAPIPLIAKVDPKKGDEVFNKWVKECVSTYLSLFIRLVSIYFAIYLIDLVTLNTFDIVSGEKKGGLFVKVFIIFGALLFVKDLPKLIESITGVKLGTDGLSLRKKMKDIGGVASKIPIAGTGVPNLARKTISGIDAKKNGMKFKTGWEKARANDKGTIADIRRGIEKTLPYSTATRKTRLENREKSEEMQKNLKKGQDMLNKLKNNSDYNKASSTKKHEMEANEIFKNVKDSGVKDAAIKNYQTMANLKDERDFKQSEFEKMKMRYERGDEGITAEAVDAARVSYVKSSSAYDKASSEFKNSILGDSDASKAYSQYTQADDGSKLYRDSNSPARATGPTGANVETRARAISNVSASNGPSGGGNVQ